MGNTTGVSSGGVPLINVSFDTVVSSGSTVTGKVFVTVLHDVLPCVSLVCRVIGEEFSKVIYYTSGNRRQKQGRHAFREQIKFMDLNFCLLQNPSGSLTRGQYEYPLLLSIPSGSPASMNFVNIARDKCGIRYMLEVLIEQPNGEYRAARNSVAITVSNPPPVNPAPMYIAPTSHPLRTLCCIPRGSVMFGVVAKSSCLSADGTFSIKYAVENNSPVRVKAIEAILVERVSFSAQGRSRLLQSYEILLQTRVDPRTAGLDLGPRTSQNAGRGDADEQETHRSLDEMLESGQYKLDFKVPRGARNTYQGSLVQVAHQLELRALTTMGTSNASIFPDVIVYSSEQPGDHPAQSVHNLQIGQTVDNHPLPVDANPYEVELADLPQPRQAHSRGTGTPVAYTALSGYPPSVPFTSFEQLHAALSQSSNPCGELEKYIGDGNSVDELTAEQCFLLFRSINAVHDQQCVASLLASALTHITCIQVARAVAGSKDLCKQEVAEKLLCVGPILDRTENAHLVKAALTPFQFMTVEKYFAAE